MPNGTNRAVGQRRTPHILWSTFHMGSALSLIMIALLFISFIATWRGMSDFLDTSSGFTPSPIVETQDTPSDQADTNNQPPPAGDLQTGENQEEDTLSSPASGQGDRSRIILQNVIVAFAVFILTLMMYVALEFLHYRGPILRRLAGGLLYFFLMLWSVGFGYGFWWSLIAAADSDTSELTSQVESAQDQIVTLRASLASITTQIAPLRAFSQERMEIERTRGGTCGGPRPGPGAGPRWRARTAVTEGIENVLQRIETGWIQAIEGALTRAQIDEALIAFEARLNAAGDANARRRILRDLNRDLKDLTIEINTYTRTVKGEVLALLGDFQALLSIRTPNANRYCYDPDHVSRIQLLVNAIEGVDEIEIRPFNPQQGRQAAAVAVVQVFESVFDFAGSLVGIEDTNDEDERPMRPLDYIALIAAIGVDLSIFVLALMSPRRPGHWLEQVPPAAYANEIRLVDLMEEIGTNQTARFRRLLLACIVRDGREVYWFVVPRLTGIKKVDDEGNAVFDKTLKEEGFYQDPVLNDLLAAMRRLILVLDTGGVSKLNLMPDPMARYFHKVTLDTANEQIALALEIVGERRYDLSQVDLRPSFEWYQLPTDEALNLMRSADPSGGTDWPGGVGAPTHGGRKNIEDKEF